MNPKSKEVLSQFLRIGLPIILSVVGGSLALSYGMQTKFDSLDRQKLMAAQKPNKLEQKKVDFDLEKEYEKMVTTVDLHKWENKRVPRPPGQDY